MHTPGPWKITTTGNDPFWSPPNIVGNGRTVAKTVCAWTAQDNEIVDNAALIAAAPELLAACRAVIEGHPAALEMAKSALEKAQPQPTEVV